MTANGSSVFARNDELRETLHRVNGVPVDADVIHSAASTDVLAIRMPVLPPTQVVIQKLRALSEHHCDFAPLLSAVRAVREQVDWEQVRASTADNDFAAAFSLLVGRLGIRGFGITDSCPP